MKNEKKAQDRNPAQWFLLLLLAASICLAFYVVRIFLHSLILAILLASVFYPVHERISRLLRGKKNLSALAGCLLVILLIVIPLLFVLIGMVNQGICSVNAVRGWLEQGNLAAILQSKQSSWPGTNYLTYLQHLGSRYLPFLNLEIGRLQDWMISASQYIGQFLLSKGGALVSNLGSLFFHFGIMIFVLFYLLRDGKVWLARFLHLFPLTKSQESILINRLRIVGRVALIGSLLTAMAQGIIGGIGLWWIAGVPPLFGGSLMAAASFIPLVGTSLVWLPVVIYLFIIQKIRLAIFLLVYCVAILSSIDNFLRPYLIQRQKGVSMSPLLVFLAILGGIRVFGLFGVIYGPLIFGLLSSLLYLYEVEFSSFLNRQDRS
jgi:predicted PurR-regulated permease PerM